MTSSELDSQAKTIQTMAKASAKLGPKQKAPVKGQIEKTSKSLLAGIILPMKRATVVDDHDARDHGREEVKKKFAMPRGRVGRAQGVY